VSVLLADSCFRRGYAKDAFAQWAVNFFARVPALNFKVFVAKRARYIDHLGDVLFGSGEGLFDCRRLTWRWTLNDCGQI